jgi:hypothetical protein
MSTDFSIRPVGVPAPTPIVRPSSEAARQAVPAELPPAQTVTATDARTALQADPGPAKNDTSHQVFIDSAAGAIVSQVVDSLTNLVVSQYPDEAVLRRRAYFRSIDLTRETASRPPAADRKV